MCISVTEHVGVITLTVPQFHHQKTKQVNTERGTARHEACGADDSTARLPSVIAATHMRIITDLALRITKVLIGFELAGLNTGLEENTYTYI